MGHEANVFAVTNLKDLSSRYRLYSIKGLDPEQNEYYQNCDYIKTRLSYLLKNPVTLIERAGVPFLVVQAGGKEPPAELNATRAHVIFEPYGEPLDLDYTSVSPENDEIRTRFLQFMFQEPLHNSPDLWQPGPGGPFFKREPVWGNDKLERFEGFSVRVVPMPDGGLGFCVDVTYKSVSKQPLPVRINRDQFRKWRGAHCVYHYGRQWYEIQLRRLDDLDVTHYMIPRDSRRRNLFQFIVDDTEKPIPPELVRLPHDTSVGVYQNSRKEERGAPTALCYPVLGTARNAAGRSHRKTILEPNEREPKIREFVQQYMLNLRFGETVLRVSPEPQTVPTRIFPVPDLSFAKGITISVVGGQGARRIRLDELGATRLSVLEEVGTLVNMPWDQQYIILPQSVADSWGSQFVRDLCQIVNHFHPQPADPINSQPRGFTPEIITYDDRRARTFVQQGIGILKRMQEVRPRPGYAVVMIHRVEDLRDRDEDQLEAMVIRKLRSEHDITAAVIHSTVGQDCYEISVTRDGKPAYRPKSDMKGKLSGYLQNVAINKALLRNHRWPFLLTSRLQADVIIGIDVKAHTAGLVVVGSNGGDIRFLPKTSKRKEKLDVDQMKAYLVELLQLEAEVRTTPISKIVIHRDGKTYVSELKGARQAIEFLKRSGTVAADASLTIVEIPKHSLASLRLFETAVTAAGRQISNPQIGTYYLVNDIDGYLCSTGRPFRHDGTVNPLHIRRIEGTMPLEDCMKDIFYLTQLTWTRPEDCTRYPITIKLNDRFLGDEATDYDEDAIDSAMILEEEAE